MLIGLKIVPERYKMDKISLCPLKYNHTFEYSTNYCLSSSEQIQLNDYYNFITLEMFLVSKMLVKYGYKTKDLDLNIPFKIMLNGSNYDKNSNYFYQFNKNISFKCIPISYEGKITFIEHICPQIKIARIENIMIEKIDIVIQFDTEQKISSIFDNIEIVYFYENSQFGSFFSIMKTCSLFIYVLFVIFYTKTNKDLIYSFKYNYLKYILLFSIFMLFRYFPLEYFEYKYRNIYLVNYSTEIQFIIQYAIFYAFSVYFILFLKKIVSLALKKKIYFMNSIYILFILHILTLLVTCILQFYYKSNILIDPFFEYKFTFLAHLMFGSNILLSVMLILFISIMFICFDHKLSFYSNDMVMTNLIKKYSKLMILSFVITTIILNTFYFVCNVNMFGSITISNFKGAINLSIYIHNFIWLHLIFYLFLKSNFNKCDPLFNSGQLMNVST